MEPFGDLIADQRHGAAAALLANINRSPEHKPEPYLPQDFIHWVAPDTAPPEETILLADKKAHADYMKAALFGKTPDH